MHTIPLKILLASCICVPKMDGRHYLTYIKVQKGYVTSTDGYQLFICHVDELDKELNLFIDPVHIKALCTGLRNKDKDGDVIIKMEQAGDEKIVNMQFCGRIIQFVHRDVGNYPDPERVIPKDGFVDKMVHFNWGYLINMQKIAKILGAFPYIKVKPTGYCNPALIEFVDCPFKAVGVVSPIRI